MDFEDESELIESAVAAYLDFLEGQGRRPDFSDLSDDVRKSAIWVINMILVMRGQDMRETPSIQELLAGTEWEDSV
jgi:hypothetical protein